jgi:uncharacterized damage-inducible protein DinB
MLTSVLIEIFERDLAKLKSEVELYANEADLWEMAGGIPNSAGNLALHLVGNLKHFLGATLGNSEFVRDRDLEFSDKHVPRSAIIEAIDETSVIVRQTLGGLTDEELARTYPIEVFGHPMSTEFFVVHLATHLTYHLGQINYHRRFLAND